MHHCADSPMLPHQADMQKLVPVGAKMPKDAYDNDWAKSSGLLGRYLRCAGGEGGGGGQ